MLEKHDEFTISVPLSTEMKKELAYAGTKSGRDTDKIADLDLHMQAGKKVAVPIIKESHDYHVMYYGEILANYDIFEEDLDGTNH